MAKGKEDRERDSEAMARTGSGEMRPANRLMDEMEWMFDQMQRSFFGGSLFGPWMTRRADTLMQRLPRLSAEDRDDHLLITVELPGLDPNDVQVECRNDTLIIRGERHQEEQAEGEQHGSYASFYRQLPLPPDVDVDRAEASFKNGLLRLRFPKRDAEAGTKRIPIASGREGEQSESRKGKAA